MPHTMTPDQVRAFLSHGTRTAKVATSGPGGQPHVMPVWFALDGEELVFTTGGDSVKARNLRRDPRAAVVVDEEVAPYAFVHIRGSRCRGGRSGQGSVQISAVIGQPASRDPPSPHDRHLPSVHGVTSLARVPGRAIAGRCGSGWPLAS